MRYLLSSLFILLAHSPTAHSLGRTVGYDELFSHFTANISAIQNCGRVKIGDEWGYFRIVQAHIYGSTMLFVDVVMHSNKDPYQTILRGFTFDELNNDHLDQELRDVSCVGTELNKVVVTGWVVPFERDEHGFRLDLDGLSSEYSYTDRTY